MIGVDTSSFAKRYGLANLKLKIDKLGIDELKNVPSDLSSLASKVDKLDIRKLETTPADLSKRSNVVNNGVLKKSF